MNPSTSHGERRYRKRGPRALPPMVVDGRDLGPAMTPGDVMIWLRQILELDEVAIVAAMYAGAARLAEDPECLPDLDPSEIARTLEEAREVSRSRVDAWRKRARHMTWLELRVLLIGLRESGA
ncbi:hypothetical protein [Amorphus sp. 3PC139-8]|uniref:hypothetical protein n=1 Tax=Amorphus sp. 3PC139-8 TaxID=2735676 RepID=UPI00345C66AE